MEQEKNQGKKRLSVEGTLLLTVFFTTLAIVTVGIINWILK